MQVKLSLGMYEPYEQRPTLFSPLSANYRGSEEIMYHDTKVLGASVFVKKIVSLSPDKFKFVSLEWALETYHFYLFNYAKGKQSAKGFREWLRTEI